MKKAVAIILACCMLMTVFVTAANAQDRGVSLEAAVAAVVDKLDPTVIDCLYSAVDDGRYFEISYHGVTENELIAQIKAISYAETSDYDPGEGKVLVGLPYSSVVKVAALENVDYISLPRGLPYEPPFNGEGGYYIIGTMTDWQLNTNYELTEAYLHDGTYYSWLYMEPDDSFMIVYSPDRKTLDDAEYYPQGGKPFNQNGTIIKEKGFYTFEFRPACDGGITYFEDDPAYWFETSGGERVQTWYYNCIFCLGYYRAPQEREPVYDNLTAGYYVVGTMNEWKLDGNYKLNSYNALDDITLRMCDSFKVAYTPDGRNITRWYPDGEGNAYNEDVRRIKSDSMFNYIEFSPDGNLEDSWTTHYGMISVVSAVPPSNPEPFHIPTEAPTEALENLIVLDNSGDTLSENVYICCHCTDPFTGEGSDIRAKMERMDNNEYGEHRYRFTTPKGTQSYYFTDGEKRTAEMPFTESVHLYLPGDLNEKGEYLVYDYLWAGGTDPVFTAGTSHTTFDRFYEEYITDFYEGDEDALWTDVFYLYDELFEHHDDSGDTDWVLLHVESFIQSDQIYQDTIGNRIVTKPGLSHPFESGYGIYDVRQDAFVPVYGGMVARYDGLAEAFDEFGEGELKPTYLYRERLKEYYNLCEYDEDPSGLMGYQELYYHRDSNGDIDWALINCFTGMLMPIEYTNVVGNRVLSPGNQYLPFDACYGIYDVKNDKFVDATSKAAYQYDNFVRAFDEVVGKGRPLGDIDNDDELSVIDVTIIQRCEAQMMEYPADDTFSITYDYGKVHYYTDFNRDGDRDILDATCIQRYLADIPYAIG